MNESKRILIVDDNPSIHEDFRKILTRAASLSDSEIGELEEFLFCQDSLEKHTSKTFQQVCDYSLDHAYSGKEALRKVEAALNEGLPYALAFVDERMPPGWNGIETIIRIWEKDPDLEIVICTAYSDYSWDEIISRLGVTDHLLFLKKPFDVVEVKQMVLALTQKWNLAKKARQYKKELERKIREQTSIISSMFQFANRLNSLNNLDDILDCIIDTIRTFIGCERISIMLVDENNEYLTIKKAIGLSEEIIKNTCIKVGEGIVGRVFAQGTIIVVNDIEKDGFRKGYSEFDAFMSLPLLCTSLVGPKIKLGVINVTNKRGNELFTDDDVKIMTYISYSASIAINNQMNELKLEDSLIGIISALMEVIDAKDHYTRGHSERVAEISVKICNQLNLPTEEIRTIKVAAILHDIGKIGIPETILSKPARLNGDEFNLIKEHPAIGDKILKDVKFLENVRDIIRHHHERIDGSGYPDGLVGETISLGSRIVGVADTFDSINSNRPYQEKIALDEIKDKLRMLSGVKLDAQCVEALLNCLNEG